MDKKKCLAAIDDYLTAANNLSISLIEWEARKLMREHHALNEFIIAMGAAFFTDKHGNEVPEYQFKYMKPFFDMIYDLNDRLNVCGTPMRFTASGRKITNW